MKVLYVKVEDDVHKDIVKEAKKLGISVSAFIRLLIARHSRYMVTDIRREACGFRREVN